MDISMAHDPKARFRAQCAVQKAAEKCINTYNGQDFKKGFWLYARQPRKNLHTGISVNKPKLSVQLTGFRSPVHIHCFLQYLKSHLIDRIQITRSQQGLV